MSFFTTEQVTNCFHIKTYSNSGNIKCGNIILCVTCALAFKLLTSGGGLIITAQKSVGNRESYAIRNKATIVTNISECVAKLNWKWTRYTASETD